MRIGGDGPEQVVRQGKFLDCVLVSEVRADLVESPVIGMVSRDFVSLGGQYVLVPAGAKLIGLAGRVQNLQQARVYIRFDRIIFPDQRSAYFPVRKVAAGDGVGSVGIEGDVDRHFGLMFGSAVMLGVVDGMAAAVEGANSSATPAARELIEARTSMNMSQVVAGILSRSGTVVPTVTVEAGTKMKVFFAADVRMTPYQRAHGSH
jgi:type IV secretion system protein VirB10